MKDYHIKDGVLQAYTGREEVLTVPDGIHTIGEGAFKACVSLKKVILPDGLRFIMENAFKGCRKLEQIEIPQGVERIGSYAFHRCHAIKRIILPDSVKSLGDCVFLYCDNLTEARIPGVRTLGKQTFLNDVLLERIEISPDLDMNCICDVFTGCGRIREISFAKGARWQILNAVEVIVEKPEVPPLVYRIATDILKMMELDGRNLIRFLVNLKHVEIPEGIESVAKSCFFDKKGIQSVCFPKSLKVIESRAFRNCISLEKVTFQGNDIQILEAAFKNCTSLKTVRTYDSREYVFSGITGLEDEDVPDIVRTIQRQVLGNFKISGTILLKYFGAESRVVIPEGITRIAGSAFAGNEAVDRMILPESLKEIGKEAFRDCVLLQTISFPERLEKIEAGAFENCVKLIRVSFSSKIKQIEERSFRHCKTLREVNFSEGLLEIKESAFYGCTALKNMQFPKSLSAIGEMAFYGCSGLKELHLLKEAEQVGSLAFAKSGIRKVRISGSGGAFGTGVFNECIKMKTLILEEGVCHISDKLAYGCTALRQVILPESIISVGKHALENTPYLEAWKENQEKLRKTEERNAETKIEIEAQKTEQFQKEIFWDGRDLKGSICISESVKIVAGAAFYGNNEVTEIYVPESVCWIGKAAFKGCKNLQKVFLPSAIQNLEAEVFSGCSSLREIILSDKAEKILGEKISAENFLAENFSTDNSSVQSVPMWNSIGERAFYKCKNLKKLCLCHAQSIEKEALEGCSILEICEVSSELWAGERAFEKTKFLEVRKDGICIVGSLVVSASQCEGRVCIPESVTGIAPYAFAGNRSITEIVFPEGLLRIGEGAFFGCSMLCQVNFPKSLREIEARAFEKCVCLKSIYTDALQIGRGAFAFCTALLHAEFPKIKKLSDSIFEGCISLKGCACKSAEEAGRKSFCNCRSLRDMDFERLQIIKEYAFEGCDSLYRVFFQNSIHVENYAFLECGHLTEIWISDGTDSTFFGEYAFFGCTMLRWVKYQAMLWEFFYYQDIFSEHFPETVRFLFCSALSCFEIKEDRLCSYQGTGRIVKIPQGIRRIEMEVFRDICMLMEIDIPESVEYIGARAFHGTAWISHQQQRSPFVIVNHMLLDGSGCEGDVVIPAEIHMICGWAFANGMKIKSIRFLAETKIEQYAFRNCIFLKEIILSDGSHIAFSGIKDREKELPAIAKQAVMDSLNCFKTNENNVLCECTGNISRLLLPCGITAVGEKAFQDGNLLTEIIFSETVKRIEKSAFAGCKWLSEVRQAQNVEYIGKRAFFGCGRLQRVMLSEKFQQMETGAFENCTSLEEILIPEGVKEIPERAFYRCHSLKSIQLPSTLRKIGKEAFAFCIQLEDILLPESVVVEERAFYKGKE